MKAFNIRSMLLLGLFSFPLTVQAEIVGRVAAVVNNEIITTVQLEKELAERYSEAVPSEVRLQVLDALIEEKLVAQRIDELGLKVSEEELEAAIQDVIKQNKISREKLIEALQQQGMGFDEYRESLRSQILRFKLLGREVQAKVEVTGEDVRAYFREHIDEYRQPANVRLSRLSFPLPERPTGEQVAEVRQAAEGALARLRAGEDFTMVLLAYSAEQRAQGGDLGTFIPGQLTPAFESAVQDLQEGEVSALIETPQAFHILQVIERNPGRVQQFDSVKDEITRKLTEIGTEERFKQWSRGLREKAYIEIRSES